MMLALKAAEESDIVNLELWCVRTRQLIEVSIR